MAQKRTKTIAERLQENEKIIRELLAEGKTESEAQKLLVPRALEQYVRRQMLGEDSNDACEGDNGSEPPEAE